MMSYYGGARTSKTGLPDSLVNFTNNALNTGKTLMRTRSGDWEARWNPRRIFTVTTALITLWLWTLYWGERTVFSRSINDCAWDKWEQWDQTANPHHLIFVADPQLVDPHTYPGRPWPLSHWTFLHTDQYIRRSWVRLNNVLYPDTVFFLGDLFDGGREWSTRTSKSEEVQWHKYNEQFWLEEYDRFGTLFFDNWIDSGMAPRAGHPDRKLIAPLPGNHDLGFGTGIRTSVRKRYNTYFGDGSRIDVIANHTFVSIDSVSFSAKESTSVTHEPLWKPVQEFLDNAASAKSRAVMGVLRQQKGLEGIQPFSHDVVDTKQLATHSLPKFAQSKDTFPTVLLTHVPLYRSRGEPCGPQRERSPPTPPPKGQKGPVFPDHRNAISVSGGYQYQNVLTEPISQEVTGKIGNISYAFSGDDHDYCEVVHQRYPSAGKGIREITVKSISWAMGVRKPGFEMLSIWNPVDEQGVSKENHESTIQTHLCLLPDQLGIFIQYGIVIGITITALLVRAAMVVAGRIDGTINPETTSPILPTTNQSTSSAVNEKANRNNSPYSSYADDSSSNGSTTSDRSVLNTRNTFARLRSDSQTKGHGFPMEKSPYSLPLVQHAGYYGASEKKQDTKVETKSRSSRKKKRGFALFVAEFAWSFLKVGLVAFTWYFWLIWNG